MTLWLKPTSQYRKIDCAVAVRWLLVPIGEKSGSRHLNKHSWCAHPLLIGRQLGHFNSQLNFAGWSADVTQIHSSVGLPPSACRSPHDGPWTIVRNFCSGGQTDTARSPAGRRMDAYGWPQDHLPILIPQLVTAKWSLDIRRMTVQSFTVSPWAVPCMFNVLCCYIDYIE